MLRTHRQHSEVGNGKVCCSTGSQMHPCKKSWEPAPVQWPIFSVLKARYSQRREGKGTLFAWHWVWNDAWSLLDRPSETKREMQVCVFRKKLCVGNPKMFPHNSVSSFSSAEACAFISASPRQLVKTRWVFTVLRWGTPRAGILSGATWFKRWGPMHGSEGCAPAAPSSLWYRSCSREQHKGQREGLHCAPGAGMKLSCGPLL